jgi:hypothetical protein
MSEGVGRMGLVFTKGITPLAHFLRLPRYKVGTPFMSEFGSKVGISRLRQSRPL